MEGETRRVKVVAESLDVECPVCHAAPNEPCTTAVVFTATSETMRIVSTESTVECAEPHNSRRLRSREGGAVTNP